MTSVRRFFASLFSLALAAVAATAQVPPPPALPVPPRAARDVKPRGPVPAVPPGALTRLGGTGLGHGGFAIIVAYAPDGKTIASGGNDSLVRVWDVATGKEVRALVGHTGNVDTVAYAADGKTIASGASDGTVRLWETATGKEKAVLRGGGGGVTVNCVCFAPDGKTLASKGHDGVLRLWDTATLKEVRTLPVADDHGTSNLVFTPDSRQVVAVDESHNIRLWNVADGTEVRRCAGHTDDVHSLDVSPDGKQIASASMDKTIRLWDVATGNEVRQFAGHTDLVSAVRFSPDRKTLASCAGDRSIRLWDLDTGKELRQMKGHVHLVSEVSFSPDGKVLASASWDHTVRLFDTATGAELPQSKRLGGPLACAALSRDGKTVVAGHLDGVVRFWDVATSKIVRELEAEAAAVVAVAWSDDASRVVVRTVTGGVAVHEATGKGRRLLIPADEALAAAGVMEAPRPNDVTGSLALSPDGKRLAVVGATMNLTIWDIETGKQVAALAPAEPLAWRVAFAPDGRTLAAAWLDGTVRLWSATTWQEVRRLGAGGLPPGRAGLMGLGGLGFSADGRTLTVSGGTAVGVWETATGALRRKLARGDTFLTVSAAGGGMASAVGEEVRLWDRWTGLEKRTLSGQGGQVTSLSFAGDGTRLVAVGSDGSAVVWDTATLVNDAKPAASAAAFEAQWALLAGTDAVQAGDAVAALIAAGEKSVGPLSERLKPGAAVDAKKIDKLIKDLDDDDFEVREKATQELEKAGTRAAAALRKARDKAEGSAEASRRIDELLKKVEGGAASGERLRTARALEVLENVGGTAAKRALESLARGPADDALTQEAQGALERLARRR